MIKEIKEAIEVLEEFNVTPLFDDYGYRCEVRSSKHTDPQYVVKSLQVLKDTCQNLIDTDSSGELPEEKEEKETIVSGDGKKTLVYNPNAIGYNECRNEMLLMLASPKLKEEIAEVIWGNATNTPRLTQAGVNEFTQAITNYLRGER